MLNSNNSQTSIRNFLMGGSGQFSNLDTLQSPQVTEERGDLQMITPIFDREAMLSSQVQQQPPAAPIKRNNRYRAKYRQFCLTHILKTSHISKSF